MFVLFVVMFGVYNCFFGMLMLLCVLRDLVVVMLVYVLKWFCIVL